MKKIIIFLFVWIPTIILSQESVFETNKAFIKVKDKRNESYALPNQKNNDLMLILAGKKSMQGILMDNSYKEKIRIMAKSLPSKFRHFIGYSIKNNVYSILFTNEQQSKFGTLQFNIDQKNYSEKILDFKLKKEKFVESIVYNNEIYLFSITKRSSDLNIYKFDSNFNPIKHTVSLEKVEYSNVKGSKIKKSAFTQLTESPDPYSTNIYNVSKIEPKNPNVIETTSKKVKIYPMGQKVVFTFDDNPSKTDLFTINLETFSLSHTSFDKVSKDKSAYKRNNTYLFDNKIFQIASANDKMNFRIIDLYNKEIIKEYNVTKEDSITFKNSPIIQEKTGTGSFGIAVDKVREMEKTAKFLRKISSADLGISVYKVDDLYSIILGGTKEISGGTGSTIAFGVIGVATGVALAGGGFTPAYSNFNPTYYNYYAYGATKSVYINCLFDKNLSHVNGEIPLNSYDFVNDFEETLEDPRAVNIFTHDNVLHYNYLHKETGKFELLRFNQ